MQRVLLRSAASQNPGPRLGCTAYRDPGSAAHRSASATRCAASGARAPGPLHSAPPRLSIAPGFGGTHMAGNARVASLSFVIALLAAAPTQAADSKLDPDPKILPKARTLATAKVDQNFDLPSDKIPFSGPLRHLRGAAHRDPRRGPRAAGAARRSRQGDRRLPRAGDRAEGVFGEDQRRGGAEGGRRRACEGRARYAEIRARGYDARSA